MEKRRRARINASLTELKSLLLDAIRREGTRQNKMEKADILEMAVKHLRQIQRQNFTGESSGDSSNTNKYHQGFHACVQEVCKYLDSNSQEDIELKTKLLNHLVTCMTSTNYQVTSAAPATSDALPSTSACPVVHIPLSPMSAGSLSPLSTTLSPHVKRCILLDNSCSSSSAVTGNDVPMCDAATQNFRSKDNIMAEVILPRETHNSNDGIPHAVMRPLAQSGLGPPQTATMPPSGVLIQHPPSSGDSYNTSNTAGSTGSIQASSVSEVNNNSIILPTFVNMNAPATFACLQQASHLQQTHFYKQQHHMNQLQLQQQLLPPLPEGSSVLTSASPVQLIPTKTANGDIAFFLSATNFINSSHIPSFTIPVLTPPSVGHAQIITSPIPQQAIQIAVSYPSDEQRQSLAFISHAIQPLAHSANQHANIASSAPNVPQQTTPLNLSSTIHQIQMPQRILPKHTITPPNTTPSNPGLAHSSSSGVSIRPSTTHSQPPYEITSSHSLISSSSHYTVNTECTPRTRSPDCHLENFPESSSMVFHGASSCFSSVLDKSGSENVSGEADLQAKSGQSSPSVDAANVFRHKLFRPWKQ